MTHEEFKGVLTRREYDMNTRAYWYLGRAFARQAIELRSWLSARWAVRDFTTWLTRKLFRVGGVPLSVNRERWNR